MEEKKEQIKHKLKTIGLGYVEIIPESSIDFVYQVYVNNTIPREPKYISEFFYLGSYAHHVNVDHDKMKKLYLETIRLTTPSSSSEQKSSLTEHDIMIGACAIFNLGLHFRSEKNFEQYIKYCQIAVERGFRRAMINLGSYYQKELNFDQMKLYLEMAVAKGSIKSMAKLGTHYRDVEPNPDKMKLYLELAINKGSIHAINLLAYYYWKQNQLDCMLQLYLKSEEKGDPCGCNGVGWYYQYVTKDIPKMKFYYRKALSICQYTTSPCSKTLTPKNRNADVITNFAQYYRDKNKPIKAFDLYMFEPGYFKTQIKSLLFEESKVETGETGTTSNLDLFCQHYMALKEKNQSLRLQKQHLLYVPGGLGFDAVKDHFGKLMLEQKQV